MSVNVSQTASLTINGITPVAGAGITLLANPNLLISGATQGDYFAETFTVNPSTPLTIQPVGDISTGRVMWVQTDQQISISLLQPITGTVTVTNGSPTVTGVGTTFNSLSVLDLLEFSSQPGTYYTISAITSNTSLTLSANYSGTTVVGASLNASNTYVVDSFLFTNSSFSSIGFINASATTAAHINLVVAGDRIVNSGGPGIF